jgi:glycosyltransferase involved in cell wall biosynthesis
MSDSIDAPGFVDAAVIRDSLARATCLLLPSEREGYGLVVVEAAAVGTPSIVVDGEDNAATELIENGVNGFVAPSAKPADLASAIVAVHDHGIALRRSTADWFSLNRRRLSLEASLQTVVASYSGVGS